MHASYNRTKTTKTRNTEESSEARKARHESASKRKGWTRTDKRTPYE